MEKRRKVDNAPCTEDILEEYGYDTLPELPDLSTVVTPTTYDNLSSTIIPTTPEIRQQLTRLLRTSSGSPQNFDASTPLPNRQDLMDGVDDKIHLLLSDVTFGALEKKKVYASSHYRMGFSNMTTTEEELMVLFNNVSTQYWQIISDPIKSFYIFCKFTYFKY